MRRVTIEDHRKAFEEGMKYVGNPAYKSFFDLLHELEIPHDIGKRVKFSDKRSRARTSWYNKALAQRSDLPWYIVVYKGRQVSMSSIELRMLNAKAPIMYYLVTAGMLLGRHYGYAQLLLDDLLNVEIMLRDLGLTLYSTVPVDFSLVREDYLKGGCNGSIPFFDSAF